MSNLIDIVSNSTYYGIQYLQAEPINALKFVKNVAFDWAEHFDRLPDALADVSNTIDKVDEITEYMSLLVAYSDLHTAIKDAGGITGLRLNDAYSGDSEARKQIMGVLKNLVVSTTQTLYVLTLCGEKVFGLKEKTKNLFLAICLAVVLISELYNVVSTWYSSDVLTTEQKFEISKSLAASIKLSAKAAEAACELVISEYVGLTCGTAVAVSKLALFAFKEMNKK